MLFSCVFLTKVFFHLSNLQGCENYVNVESWQCCWNLLVLVRAEENKYFWYRSHIYFYETLCQVLFLNSHQNLLHCMVKICSKYWLDLWSNIWIKKNLTWRIESISSDRSWLGWNSCTNTTLLTETLNQEIYWSGKISVSSSSTLALVRCTFGIGGVPPWIISTVV